MMKKPFLCLVALILMLFSASALAAGSDEALITDTLRQAGITEPVQLTQWGDSAACFAETDGVKRLILLERHDGVWQIVIDNPTALIQEWDWPELYSDTDTAIYWEYNNFDGKTAMVFSSWREAGVWGQVEAQIAGNEAAGALYPLTCIGWRENHGGEIVLTHFIDDENGNTVRESVEYVPAPQLSAYSHLATYDVTRFPVFEQASALEEIYTELTFVGTWTAQAGGWTARTWSTVRQSTCTKPVTALPGSWTGTASSAGTARVPSNGSRLSRQIPAFYSQRRKPAASMPASTRRPSGRRSKSAWAAVR